MRSPVRSLRLVVLGLALWAGQAPGAMALAEQVRIAGQDYVRLADWARNNGLEPRWLKQDESLQLSNPSTKLVLTVDHRDAQINGLEVWLLFPVVLRSGSAYMAQLDAQTTLLPILSPPKYPRKVRVKTVCLDPGHGGKDTGYIIGANQEKIGRAHV